MAVKSIKTQIDDAGKSRVMRTMVRSGLLNFVGLNTALLLKKEIFLY